MTNSKLSLQKKWYVLLHSIHSLRLAHSGFFPLSTSTFSPSQPSYIWEKLAELILILNVDFNPRSSISSSSIPRSSISSISTLDPRYLHKFTYTTHYVHVTMAKPTHSSKNQPAIIFTIRILFYIFHKTITFFMITQTFQIK